MYLPRNLPLSRPHVAMWIGESGRRYDFAVCRPGTICVDEAAVYILARHEEQVATPLFVGHTTSLHKHFGLSRERCPEEWRRALAIGMTHVHLRFDTFSKMTREAEVGDLVAALAPVLNDQLVLEEGRSSSAPETAAASSASIDGTAVYHRERPDIGAEARSPALASVHSGRHTSAERAVPPPLFRADPAREDDGEGGDFELPAAAFDMPPDRQLRVGTPPGTATSGKLEEEIEVIPLAPTEPIATPESQRQSGQITAAPLPESAEVIRFMVSTKSAQLQRFVTRVREFVARMRAPRRLNALDEAGSAEPPPVTAAVPTWPVGRPATAGTAEPYVRTGEARDSLPEDTGEEEARDSLPEDTGEEEARDSLPEDTGEEEARDRDSERFQQEDVADAKPAETSEDTLPESAAAEAAPINNLEARRGLGLDASAPVVLFAGDLSHDAGADILFDAIVTVCGGNHEAQFVFAGDGALKGQLQEWASRAGLERRCRFLGHVPSESFGRVLIACDFVVIPARVRQDEDLARMAIVAGKPVVTTHQAAIPLIVHGRNGLIAYDNPGSLVWAIRALLGPLYVDLRLQVAESTRLGSAA